MFVRFWWFFTLMIFIIMVVFNGKSCCCCRCGNLDISSARTTGHSNNWMWRQKELDHNNEKGRLGAHSFHWYYSFCCCCCCVCCCFVFVAYPFFCRFNNSICFVLWAQDLPIANAGLYSTVFLLGFRSWMVITRIWRKELLFCTVQWEILQQAKGLELRHLSYIK